MLLYKTRVSAQEKLLIETIQKVGYGEIFAPKFPFEVHNLDIEVGEKTLDLLGLIRDGHEISIISVYQGEPAVAEVDLLIHGFRCRKKVKFPTG